MKTFTEKKMKKFQMSLDSFRCLIPMYEKVKDNPQELYDFCMLHRNPAFDISGTSQFNTGVISKSARNSQSKKCKDHFIQRSLSMKFVFDEIHRNPNMEINQFIEICLRYFSFVTVTKQEHDMVTSMAKKTGKYNFQLYRKCGIKLYGVGRHTKDLVK